MNTYRLYLYGRDGAVAQVSEIECPDDSFAAAFAAERRRDFTCAELWLDHRLVARIDGPAPGPGAIVAPSAEEGSDIGAR